MLMHANWAKYYFKLYMNMEAYLGLETINWRQQEFLIDWDLRNVFWESTDWHRAVFFYF